MYYLYLYKISQMGLSHQTKRFHSSNWPHVKHQQSYSYPVRKPLMLLQMEYNINKNISPGYIIDY